eukprot:3657545-Pleurochrysis_carterae.AAC.1
MAGSSRSCAMACRLLGRPPPSSASSVPPDPLAPSRQMRPSGMSNSQLLLSPPLLGLTLDPLATQQINSAMRLSADAVVRSSADHARAIEDLACEGSSEAMRTCSAATVFRVQW